MSEWTLGDPRWSVRRIDTSELPGEAVADELAAWVGGARAAGP